MSQPIAELTRAAKVLVAVGPGGVGKTTSSAAMALEGARQGRRVAVLTIDPARRLATALGMREMGNEERFLEPAQFRAMGLEPPSGRLSAMMLDIKRTWDGVVTKYHPDPERRDALLQNRFYTALSSALAGSQEYMAMEQLYELSHRAVDPLDLIVLDTPPSTNAVDFLDAPVRMLDALDNDATRWLTEPLAGRSGKLLDLGGSLLLRTLGRFTGGETLSELADLLGSFQAMFDGFRARARAVRELLASPKTHFVIVSSPRPGPMAVARKFEKRLAEEKIQIGAFVLNRATPNPLRHGPLVPERLAERLAALGGSPGFASRLSRLALDAAVAAERERELAVWQERAEEQRARPTPIVMVPELDRDVHDLAGLERLRAHLLSPTSVVAPGR